MTYTFVTLEVSQAAYDEIRKKLLEAGYEHAITADSTDDEVIDMHGIALLRSAEPEPSSAFSHSNGADCRCKPKRMRLCPEDCPRAEQMAGVAAVINEGAPGPDCWRCRGRGLVELEDGDPADAVVLVHQ